ncbi:hypothetical protein K1719_016653 [Acacia pycnantha]|nr:hypothetical protein K1719_016653 [Acacia pycnantha]
MYEVSGRGEKVGVNLTKHTCACNFWQLTGLPYEHAIAAIAHKNEAAENYVHQWLTMDALHATYEHTLNPVNSDEYWPSSDEPKPVPPPLKRPAGRPKKHRKKDPTEDQEKSTTKLKRTCLVKCSKCGQLEHYAKTCKGPAAPRNKQKSAPMSISIETNMHGEIPLSQGGPTPENDSQPARGNSPQPSIPTESSHLPSEETMRAASSGTRTRLCNVMLSVLAETVSVAEIIVVTGP